MVYVREKSIRLYHLLYILNDLEDAFIDQQFKGMKLEYEHNNTDLFVIVTIPL